MTTWNNLVVHEYRAVFFLVAKGANSSIKASIKQSLGLDDHPDSIQKGWVQSSPRRIAGSYSHYHWIAFVRNPFDRLVSCWWQKLHRHGHSRLDRIGFENGMSFDAFLRHAASFDDDRADHHFRSQTWGMVSDGRFLPEFVGRFERLSRDWDRMRERFALDLPDLPHRNGSDHKAYRDYYTPELRRLVEDRWEQDLRMLGYGF